MELDARRIQIGYGEKIIVYDMSISLDNTKITTII